jgi:hypothetical protein
MDRSWQGKPADTIKASLENVEAEVVNLAESDGFPSDVASCKRESADAAE